MKTVEELYREMMDTFARETGTEPDGAGELAVRMYALATQLYGLYQEIDWTSRQCFPQTATGAYLEYHAFLRGLQREPARRAIGTIRFSIDEAVESILDIPEGTVCMTAGRVEFATTRRAVIQPGETSVDVPAHGVQPGPGGNVPAWTVRTMAVAPEGIVRCTNPEAFAGGQETEGDEALRQRILDTYRRLPNGTNTAYYEREALAVEGVAAVGILPKARGVGTVDIIVAGPEGMPSDDLVQRVRSAMERKREIAVTVWVSPPEAVETDVTVVVTAQKGFAPLEVQKKTEETIRAWFSGERLGKDLLLAELGDQIFHVDGVANYHIRTPDQDLTVKEKQLPVLKTLRVEVFS